MASIILRKPSNKRINPDKLFQYDNFGIPGFAIKTLSGAFRDNIRVFLQNFAEIQDYTVNEMRVWCTSLFSENYGVFPLYTLEETVQDSVDPFCDYCELAEWGHHFVCKRKYHLVIPSKENWNAPLDEVLLEFESHKLYGLIHCNGYGHLISINGLKNNSKFLRADDSMKFWDRLCTLLKARSISAHYLSKTDSIELSLIHGVAHGRPWLGKWGYKFSGGGGSLGITEQKYNAAIRFLSRLSVDRIIGEVWNNIKLKRIKERIEIYKKLSSKPLTTIGDLLRFMLDFESRIPRDIYNGCKPGSGTEGSVIGYDILVNSMTENCRWPHRRLENVLLVIVDLLKQHKADNVGSEGRMSRQELRDGARKSIGDTGLIDFVIKSIKCFQMDDQIIRRAINPFSRLSEFTIHDTSQGGSHFNLSRDVWFLYENVLAGYPETRTILSSNNLVKEWPIKGKIVNQSMELICKVLPSFDELDSELTRRLSPGEVVVVEPRVTIGYLRRAAQCALRDTYCIMDEFEVSQVGGLKKIDDEEVVSSVLEGGDQVWVRGSGLNFSTWLRYEDGGKKAITSRSNGIS
ncbi:hypothetical protein ACS0TY_011383 [Phlomoides rotata]